MTLFWLLAGALVVVAFLFLLPPLLRKPPAARVERDALNVQVIRDQLDELRADLESGRLDQAAYAAARHDLERELLEDVEGSGSASPAGRRGGRWLALVLLLAVPVLAVVTYRQIGAEQTLERIAAGKAAVREAGSRAAALENMVASLAERMQQEPDNVEGWALLGRSYAVLQQFDQAAAAYAHAAQLAPENADILSNYADALVAASNGDFTDEVGDVLARALAADPGHLKSLWLRGHWKYRHGDAQGAIDDWRKVVAALPPQDENTAVIQQQIQLAQERAGISPDSSAPAQTAAAPAGAVAGTASVRVRVALAPGLRDKVSPDDTLFIFARAVKGPRMPLAIVRKRAADLPATVTLDDSQAMSPAMSLSKFDEVSIGARISKSGQAMPSSGDLQGTVSPISTDDGDASLTIDEVIP